MDVTDDLKENGTTEKGTEEQMKVCLFMGSVRRQRLCDRVTKFVQNTLEESNHTVIVVGEF